MQANLRSVELSQRHPARSLARGLPARAFSAMVPGSIVATLALMPAVLASDNLPSVAEGCRNIITQLIDQGHSTFELSAYCRANLPPQTCREAANVLGEQPWSPENIGRVCKSWESMPVVKGRGL